MNGPPQLPSLVLGQQIKNVILLFSGPYNVRVTQSMVEQREKENRELARRWQLGEQRRKRMMELRGNDDDYFGDFKEFNVRRRFVRRVFSILTLQMIFTALVIGSFMFFEEAKLIMMTYPSIWIASLAVFMFTYLSISCCECARRQAPCNGINLILLTSSMSYLTAFVSVHYSVEAVLIATGATALVTTVIFFLAACTKFQFDLTRRAGLMLIVSLVATVGLLIMIIVLNFTHIRGLQVAISIAGTLLLSMYLFFDVQTMMGGKTIELSPDEVVYATTQIYVDVLLLYRYILLLGGSVSE
ncbi:protein lifeguard 2-like isoform X1 [Nasonia vitripennis]|uniref:Uncharacterized protein n=1 Tax=Nasonia vitripennis TaxID=7425 RepID=A0A7M7Q0R6_NASVI|nr:protein lifeguard 2-like isoform X1 [Nasonia vitripennis]